MRISVIAIVCVHHKRFHSAFTVRAFGYVLTNDYFNESEYSTYYHNNSRNTAKLKACVGSTTNNLN